MQMPRITMFALFEGPLGPHESPMGFYLGPSAGGWALGTGPKPGPFDGWA
jgi:hypothetical protein